MTHAASRLCRIGYVDEILGGITQLRFLDARVSEDRIEALAERIAALHGLLVRGNGCIVSITADEPSRYAPACNELVRSLPLSAPSIPRAADRPAPDALVHGIEIPSAVNFVARARGVKKVDAATTGTLFLLARHLSTGYLWDKVRVEGGAYGGSASFSSTEPVFHCASYRDPNLVRTLEIIDASARDLKRSLTPESLEQSVIGAIGKIDAPRTPHDKGLSETIALLGGRSEAFRQRLREAVLDASPGQLLAAADEVFAESETATTVIGSVSAFDDAERAGLRLVRSPLLEDAGRASGK
jgi:Zn-dependent M16 (insulinase) family peptidase